MARIAFYATGFSTDPRDFIPFPLPGLGGANGYDATFDEAFAYVWRISEYLVEWDVTFDNGVDPPLNVVGSAVTANAPFAITDERDIGCHGFLEQAWSTADSTGGMILDSFNTFTQLFFITVAMRVNGGAIGILDADSGVGPASAVAFTVLGHALPSYATAGVTVTGSVDVTIAAYYPYRDSAGLNPIWDVTTGAQLIVPVPNSL